jgi:hypothetical protein
MALVVSTLQTALYNIFTNNGQNITPQAQDAALKIAQAIDAYIKTASVSVNITGSAAVTTAPGTAPVTGSGTGTLS